MSRKGNKATRHQGNEERCARRSAFTLVELLVVIVVIGVLLTLLITVGGKVFHGQKVAATKVIMQTVQLAIDQFAAEDPLKVVYNNSKLRYPGSNLILGRTFGPYPPYQLKNAAQGSYSVAGALEPAHALSGGIQDSLQYRLYRDLGRGQDSFTQKWVAIQSEKKYPNGDRNDDNDIRALYAYLAAYTPDALSQIPEASIKPLLPGTPEFINPSGQGTAPGANGLIDVFGIYDAWGVPLDYFLQVKLEYKMAPPRPGDPQSTWKPTWVVTDRVPVLRSRGASAEVVAAAVEAHSHGDDSLLQPQNWIYSELFPQPAANRTNLNFRKNGVFNTNTTSANGWARAVGQYENCDYTPQQQE